MNQFGEFLNQHIAVTVMMMASFIAEIITIATALLKIKKDTKLSELLSCIIIALLLLCATSIGYLAMQYNIQQTQERDDVTASPETEAPSTASPVTDVPPTAPPETAPPTAKPFYGVWWGAYYTEAEAQNLAESVREKGFDPKVFVTTDWSNLNSDEYYVVAVGVYSSEDEADEALLDIEKSCPGAYVKYSGNWQGQN